jgi:hypothetical protein
MDPNACLKRWAMAVLNEDRAEANDAYFALRAWIERGGFEPSWGNGSPSRKQFFQQYNPRTGRLE